MSHSTSGKGTKKSNFTGATTIADSDTLDFVRSGQNLKITYSNFLDGLGVSGSITAVGNTSDFPILDNQGTINGIRNIQAGDGIDIEITPDNSLKFSTSFVFDDTGTQLVDDSTAKPIVVRSLVEGTNISLSVPAPGQIQIDNDITILNNIVEINDLSDFPAQDAGVIELTDGEDVTYIVDASTIDLSSVRFTATGGNCVIAGLNRFSSKFEASTLSDLFTVTDCGFSLEFLSIDAVNTSNIVNFTASGDKSLVLNNAVILNCRNIATVAGAFTTSLRTCAFVSSSVGGITWTGTDNVQVNITNTLAVGWTGTLIDLGTATFNLVDIAANNRFISPAGTTILSGLAASGNIESGGRGIVTGSIFNGSGTAISGISAQDLKWTFASNVFADNVTKNTKSSAKQFLSAPRTAPTAVAGSGVFIAVGGADWTSNVANRWQFSTDGIGTYLGLDDMDFYITHKATIEPGTGGAVEMKTQLYIDGSPEAETIGTITSGSAALIAGDGLFTISSGQTVQLFTAVTGAVDIDFTSAGVSIIEA